MTHLPQIAAFARHHFRVYKEVVGGRTETIVKWLNESERVQELSRMLGGETITQTVRRHALEMLEHSREPVRKGITAAADMAKRYLIETFGCQMNDLDSEKIAGNLRNCGMEPVDDPPKRTSSS